MLLMVLVVNKEDLKLNPLPPSPCMYMEPVELLVLPTASGYIIASVTQSSPCGSEPNGESTPSNPSQNPILKPLLPISKYGVPFWPKPKIIWHQIHLFPTGFSGLHSFYGFMSPP